MNSANQQIKQKEKFTVHNAVGAQIQRQGKGKSSYFKIDLGVEWQVSDDVAVSFVRQIESKFSVKAKLHNFFKDDFEGGSLEIADKLYSLKEDNGFSELASHILNRLEDAATEKASTSLSDAYVVIAYYTSNLSAKEYDSILVVLLDSKSGFNFTDRYEPKNRVIINLDSLKQAAMINASIFESVYPSVRDDSYLYFIQGTQSSDFFKEALDCGSSISNAESVQQIFAAVEGFSAEHGLSPREMNKIHLKVENKLSEYAGSGAKGKAVKLDYIQGWVDECLSDNHPGRGKFSEYVNVHDYQVNEWTKPNENSIKKASTFLIQDEKKSYSCVVNKSVIGAHSSNSRVKVDKDCRHIMIPLSDEDREEILSRIEKDE
ncbi:nucleoid-associated protein [Vreelandella piezotolerans]|uniref:nucleoid-associated protein n=1 Tax=Vreelandella piezotolerans TaxID=2609667 RepID=UPI001C62678B|nr:nucleoid-associated protein [Halomonas piezotolerans]